MYSLHYQRAYSLIKLLDEALPVYCYCIQDQLSHRRVYINEKRLIFEIQVKFV